jgi:uncharacterized lipoprotein YddW (UPF0748 family)
VTFRPRSSWPGSGLAGGLVALLVALVARPCVAAPAPDGSASQAESWVAAAPDSAPVDYMWVLRTSLIHAEDVPRVIERAKRMGVRGLLVQVIGRGDAWYRSDRLPAPEPLQGSGRDRWARSCRSRTRPGSRCTPGSTAASSGPGPGGRATPGTW